MQPRRGARGGPGGRPSAGGVSAWMGRFGAGSAGTSKPNVIRVGPTFQAVVPVWTGPVALDGSSITQEGTQAVAVPNAIPQRKETPKELDDDSERVKKSARVEARRKDHANEVPKAVHFELNAHVPKESEPDRASRLGGIKVWPPEGAARKTRASLGNSKKELPLSARLVLGSGANDETVEPSTATEKEKAHVPVSAPVAPNPSVKAAAAQRAAAAVARAMAASREPKNAPGLGSNLFTRRKEEKKEKEKHSTAVEDKTAVTTTQTTTKLIITHTADPSVTALLSTDTMTVEKAYGVVVATTPQKSGDKQKEILLPKTRPSPVEVEIARAHLDGRLRASCASPALMGLNGAGVTCVEYSGWTKQQAAAFEEYLKTKKFSIFAISRLGTGRKKPMDAPAKESDKQEEDDDEKETAKETADPLLANKTFNQMIEYYYNAYLTRPEVEDDDDDRSACDEDEFNEVPELGRGGGKGVGVRDKTTADQPVGTTAVPRNASERELARLDHNDTSKQKPKRVRKKKEPVMDGATASLKVSEFLTWTLSAAANISRATRQAETSSKKRKKGIVMPDGSVAARNEAQGITEKNKDIDSNSNPSLDAKTRGKMLRRMRQSWTNDVYRYGVSSIAGRARKHPVNQPQAGFSSEDEA